MANRHLFEADYVVILTTKKFRILVDVDDFEKIKRYSWFISNGYVYANINNKKIMITKFLLKPKHLRRRTYYLNGNALDNRKSNISLSKNIFIDNKGGTHTIIINCKAGECRVLIDSEDIEKVKDITWGINKNRYVCTKLFNPRRTLYLSRYLLNLNGELDIDHINLDKLDNRRKNLRICLHVENTWNRRKYNIESSSKYMGLRRRNGNWDARIKVKNKQFHIGTFTKEEAAASAYNYFARIFHKEFACLNEIEEIKDWYNYFARRGVSGYKGISKYKDLWRARVVKNGKEISLGYYKTKEEAARAYNLKILDMGLPLTKLNFNAEVLEHQN